MVMLFWWIRQGHLDSGARGEAVRRRVLVREKRRRLETRAFSHAYVKGMQRKGQLTH